MAHQIFVKLQKAGILPQHPVLLFQLLVDLPLELWQQLLQKFLDFVAVFDLRGLAVGADEVEGRAAAIVHHNLRFKIKLK